MLLRWSQNHFGLYFDNLLRWTVLPWRGEKAIYAWKNKIVLVMTLHSASSLHVRWFPMPLMLTDCHSKPSCSSWLYPIVPWSFSLCFKESVNLVFSSVRLCSEVIGSFSSITITSFLSSCHITSYTHISFHVLSNPQYLNDWKLEVPVKKLLEGLSRKIA